MPLQIEIGNYDTYAEVISVKGCCHLGHRWVGEFKEGEKWTCPNSHITIRFFRSAERNEEGFYDWDWEELTQ